MSLSGYWQDIRRGERPLAPIVAALVVIWGGFAVMNPTFLHPENLVNLTLQSVSTGVIALGVVVVLLAGQIDLSVGSLSGLAAAIVATGSVSAGWPLAVAVAAALAAGVGIGLLYGVLVSRAGLSGFVLTLAGLLVFAGIQWQVLGPSGSINLPFDSWLVRLAQSWFVPDWLAFCAVAALGALMATGAVRDRARRRRAELPAPSLGWIAVRVGVTVVVLGGAVAYLSLARGVGWSVVLFLGLVAVVDVLLRRTRWGRGVFAVGGDARSARMAGVPVKRILISCFAICSGLAALGGVLAAGRLAAANQSTGGGELFLLAIAAAVIGGTSLFGGRGSAWSALLGVLVIQSIANGLTLLDLDAATRNIVTGLVLALAISIDSALRRRRRRSPV